MSTSIIRFFLVAFSFFSSTHLLLAQWQPLPGPNGGTVTCWAESSAGELYAGATAGIFKSEDGGRTWLSLPGNNQIAALPTELEWDNGNLYMATQAYNSSNRALWKSSDEGASWTQLRNDLFDQAAFAGVFEARNDTIVVSASPTGFLSKDGGLSWETSVTTGLWNILGTDQGWFATFYSTMYKWSSDVAWLVTYQNADLAYHPVRVLAAGQRTYIFHSTGPEFKFSEDGGSTWINGLLPIVYTNQEVSVAERQDTVFVQGGGSIAYSTDGAQTWSVLPTIGLPRPVRACFFHPSGAIVAMTDHGIFRADTPGAAFVETNGFASQDARAILPGGGGSWWMGTSKGLFYSPDNGGSWQKMFQDYGNLLVTWVRQSGTNVVAGNDTLMLYSPDGGQNWTRRTLPAAYFADVELKGNKLFLGACLGTWSSEDWGQSWQSFSVNGNAGDICTRIWQQRDSILAVAAQWSEVFVSRDTGLSWQDFSAGLGGIPYISFELGLSPEHIYAVSGYRLMRSPLSGPQWTEVPLPVTVSSADGPLPRYFQFNGDTVLAGIPNAGIYRSTDWAQSWSSWSPTPLYQRANAYLFTDSLRLMAIKGGVWYVGNLPGLDTYGGRVYADLNDNQSFDSLDIALTGHLVQLKNQKYLAVTGTDGHYAFDWRGLSDSLSLLLYSTGAVVSPEKHAVNGAAKDLDFAVSAITLGTDLAVDITAASVPRPGFAFNLYLTCRNDGYLPGNGSIFLAKDPSLGWAGFGETPQQVNGDTARWLLKDIPPGGMVQFRITLQVNPDAQLGSLLYFSARADLEQWFEVNGANNTALGVVQVLGSFDPNDKSVVPAGPITPAMVADSQALTYTIRFQNTGTFPAEFIRITDTLSPLVDLSSLRILSASHRMEWGMQGNVLKFYFPDIQLPDSLSNEPGSHGFVKFRLQVRPDLQKGSKISNFADIYFDFNTPVRTNTVQTLVDEISAILTPPGFTVLDCRLAPNPVRDLLNVSWENNGTPVAADLELYDSQGKRIRSLKQASTPVAVPVRDLPSGIYWLKIRSGKAQRLMQWVKM